MITIPLTNVIELGLIYGLVALGVYLTFRVINFPDLSVDGTFPLGAAVVAILLTNGVHPIIATLIAAGAGMIAGCITGYLHVYLRIMGLLAGILTMTALYSINIRIMGRPNIALLDVNTLFANSQYGVWILLGIVFIVLFTLRFFLASQYGLALRAAGINPGISRSYGVRIGSITILALAISNGLVAFAGALFAQIQGFADVSLGTGTIVIGLASIMIGEALFRVRKIQLDLFGCVIGSILYRLAIAIALNSQILGLQASDLNLITVFLVILALMMPKLRRG
jgi:putative ABC transport system permease protein